jgi:formylglycine-generating enzyme required for sulfatase activity
MNSESKRALWVIIGLTIFTTLSVIFIAPHKKSVSVFNGHEMVLMKSGEFMMGPTEDASAWIKDNTGLKDWTLSSKAFSVEITSKFYIAKHETTVEQYRAFVEDVDFKTLADRGHFPITWDKKNQIWARQPGYSWAKPDFHQEDDFPVVCLSWGDANSYCEWLTVKALEEGVIAEGWEYRLPTEQEWEYAARAGGTTIYAWGDNPTNAQFYANVLDSTPKPDGEDLASVHFDSEDGFAFTAPVGQFKPNKNGLYDIQGNAWEWCINDYFDYPECNTSNKFLSKDYKYKVLKGGSWDNYMGSFAVTLRRVEKPWFASDTTSFRVVLAKEE